MANLKISGNEITIIDDGSFISKLIASCKGKITITTPFGKREIKRVKKAKQIEP